jgi:DNA-binding MarR family transcriptional regulator
MKSVTKSSAKSPRPLDRRFGYRFSLLSRALGQQMLLYVEREFGLGLAEYRILTVLEDSESPSIKEIATKSQIDKAQVTRCMTTLAKRGLVTQTVDAQDRRLRSITLTKAGRSLLASMLPFNKERNERLERSVTKSDLDILWKVLDRFDREVEAMLNEQKQSSAQHRSA